MEITTSEAAKLLAVSVAEVRRLLRAGDLTGRRLESQWLVDAGSVHARSHGGPRPGRPWTPRVALAALMLLSGQDVDFLEASERSRLRKTLRNSTAHDIVRRAQRLQTIRKVRVSESGLNVLRDSVRAKQAALTGLSAIELVSAALMESGNPGSNESAALHLALSRQATEQIVKSAKARDAVASANVVLHELPSMWHVENASDEFRALLAALVVNSESDARLRSASRARIDAALQNWKRAR